MMILSRLHRTDCARAAALVLLASALVLPAAAQPDVFSQAHEIGWHGRVREHITFKRAWPVSDEVESWFVESAESFDQLPPDVDHLRVRRPDEAIIAGLSRRTVTNLHVHNLEDSDAVKLLCEYLTGESAQELRVLKVPLPGAGPERTRLLAAVAGSRVSTLILEDPHVHSDDQWLAPGDLLPLNESRSLRHVSIISHIEQEHLAGVIVPLMKALPLRTLSVHSHADAGAFKAIAEHAPGLRTLRVTIDSAFGEYEPTEWSKAIARFEGLERLDIEGPTAVSPSVPPKLDLQPLRALPRLRHLELTSIEKLDVQSYEALGSMPALRTLRINYGLGLDRHNSEELEARLISLSQSELEVLWLENVSLPNIGAQTAAVSLNRLAAVSSLKELYLDFRVTPDGLGSFEGHPNLRRIWFANIRKKAFLEILAAVPLLEVVPTEFFGREFVQALPLLKSMKNLQELHIYGNEDPDEPMLTAEHLRELAEIRSLRVLRLRFCQFLKPEDLKHLRGLPNLAALDLSANKALLTPEAVSHLCEILTLRHLNVGDANELDDATLRAVARMAQLRVLTAYYADSDTQTRIRELFVGTNPACEVRFE
jgi:hypothetical protein